MEGGGFIGVREGQWNERIVAERNGKVPDQAPNFDWESLERMEFS